MPVQESSSRINFYILCLIATTVISLIGVVVVISRIRSALPNNSSDLAGTGSTSIGGVVPTPTLYSYSFYKFEAKAFDQEQGKSVSLGTVSLEYPTEWKKIETIDSPYDSILTNNDQSGSDPLYPGVVAFQNPQKLDEILVVAYRGEDDGPIIWARGIESLSSTEAEAYDFTVSSFETVRVEVLKFYLNENSGNVEFDDKLWQGNYFRATIHSVLDGAMIFYKDSLSDEGEDAYERLLQTAVLIPNPPEGQN